jgi:hypothetical protein
MRCIVTAAVSDELGLIFAHEINNGAQFYTLTDIVQPDMRMGYIEARTSGITLPVGFISGSPFAVLANKGMYTFKFKSVWG